MPETSQTTGLSVLKASVSGKKLTREQMKTVAVAYLRLCGAPVPEYELWTLMGQSITAHVVIWELVNARVLKVEDRRPTLLVLGENCEDL